MTGLRVRAALQFDDDAHPLPIRFVAQIANVFDLVIAHEIGDAFDERRLVDLVRQFGDDDARFAAARFFGVNLAAHDDAPVAGRVRLLDALRRRE